MDYDEQSGLGHVSRSRAIIETISSFTNELYISSDVNPFETENQLVFLNQPRWISHEEAESSHFDLVYVDSYSFEVLNKVEHLPIERKILLIDSNFFQELPSWPDVIIDLERLVPRDQNFGGTYLFGDILIHSELELTKERRKKNGLRNCSSSNLTAVVNFGGSITIETYFRKLESTFLNYKDIFYVVYCPSSLCYNLKTNFQYYKNVQVKPFSTDYLKELATCDFLITNSGTSFIEGLFVDVPMVIFNLFPNAEHNFERLRNSKKVIYSGFATEIESDWQGKALECLRTRRDLPKSKSDNNLEIEILDGIILERALKTLYRKLH